MKRVLVAAMFAGTAVGISGQGSVSISAIDRNTAGTFTLITITGSGFDAGAAISVVFSARDAITATVPAATATATAVRVAVPPLVNSVTGDLFDTSVVADVQVVQVTSSAVMTSNTLGGFSVQPPPQADGPPGTTTRALLRTLNDVQSDLRRVRGATAGFGDVLSASQAFSDRQQPVLDAVDLIMRAPDATANLPTRDSLPLSISAKSLRAADRVSLGLIRTMNAAYSQANPGTRQTPCTCNPISDLDRSLCEFRVNPCGGYDGSRTVNTEVAAALYGAQFSALGAWAATGLSSASFVASETATGFELLFTQVLAYLSAVLSGNEPPGASTLLRDSGAQLLEDLGNSGLGVLLGLQSAVDLTARIETVVTQTRGPMPTAPSGGLITPAPMPGSLPANTRPKNVYTGRQTHYWIATPINQQVTTLQTATLPAPRAGRFDGNYSGTSTATCTVVVPDVPPITQSASAPIVATVSNGTVSAGGGGVGSVSEAGRFTAPAVAGGGITCQTGGHFWFDDQGRTGATGFITCGGQGVSCSGTWNLRRQ
jgi:hypothetical protein